MTERGDYLDYAGPRAPTPRPQGEILSMVAVAAGLKAAAWHLAGIAIARNFGSDASAVDFAVVGGIVSMAICITLIVIAMVLRYQRIYLFVAVMALCLAGGLGVRLLAIAFSG